MEGVIEGGWEFVWAAYGVTWAGLLLYGLHLFHQRRLVDLETRALSEEERS